MEWTRKCRQRTRKSTSVSSHHSADASKVPTRVFCICFCPRFKIGSRHTTAHHTQYTHHGTPHTVHHTTVHSTQRTHTAHTSFNNCPAGVHTLSFKPSVLSVRIVNFERAGFNGGSNSKRHASSADGRALKDYRDSNYPYLLSSDTSAKETIFGTHLSHRQHYRNWFDHVLYLFFLTSIR